MWKVWLWWTAVAWAQTANEEFFEKQVRPILVRNCQGCHGKAMQRGGLRLDSRAALLTGGALGPAVVPGNADQSLLVQAVRYGDEHLQMPPMGKLKAEQIAALEEWVKRGAAWPGEAEKSPAAVAKTADARLQHWAFQPIKPVPVPPGAPHPIDAFLQQKISAARLKVSPKADALTLLRRVRFNLTGLPPTEPEMAEAGRPGAYEALVERLLHSRQYGEHWGRHWLDVARYADSNGSEVDHALAQAWRYRDYVIGAFEHDKPFNQFITEQLAGDLMARPTPESLAATGLLMLGAKSLAELDKPKLVADIVDEQVDTVSRAFMGLTMGCARCHDHKFDPLPTADYYAMAGIFFSTRMMDVSKRVATWTERPIDPASAARLETLQKKLETLRQQRADAVKASRGTRQKMAESADFLVVEAEHYLLGNVVVDRDDFGKGIGVVRTKRTYPDEVQYEFSVPQAGEYQLELRYASSEARPVEIVINGVTVETVAAGAITGGFTADAQRWFTQGRYVLKAGTNTMAFRRDGPMPLFDKWLVGKPRNAPYASAVPNQPAPQENEEETRQKLAKLDQEIAALEKEVDAVPMAMAPYDGPVADSAILVRGSPATPGKIVARGFPHVAGNWDALRPGKETSGRLELAKWLTDPRHVLTARVIVNRVWLWQFGQGLVGSPDNFGLRGEAPSHPELLDWLANWFMEHGWSIRALNQLICTSEAYQRAGSSEVQAADPANRLLASFPRRRLTAEEMRDAMLAASGRLDLAPGGSLMEVRNRTYANGGNAPKDIVKKMHYDSARRSVYLPEVRTGLYDFFAAFDYPAPGLLTGQRANTTVAPQALFLMNSPFVQAQASEVAARLLAGSESADERLGMAYRRIDGRPPSAAEVQSGLRFLEAEEEAARTAGAERPRDVAWQRLAHVLFMANDFLYLR